MKQNVERVDMALQESNMKDRNYWLDRGKGGPKENGFVCVGVGDDENYLSKQLEIDIQDLFLSTDSCKLSKGNYGDEEEFFYYLTEDKFNELFPMETQNAEVAHTIPHSFFIKVIEGLRIGLENTEEVFVENGSRKTRSERMKAQRLESEMTAIGNLITELNTFL